MNDTILWYDYETFGLNTYNSRIAQFSSIRTNLNLDIIEKPTNLYCKPSLDFYPDPIACLITGITPQYCKKNGIEEYKFMKYIEKNMSVKNTISMGYNNSNFDDEITRLNFWRNFIDPYKREWHMNCGRLDLLTIIRSSYCLMKQSSIKWPIKNNFPIFKLEIFSKINGYNSKNNHDALEDVKSTIFCARLIKKNYPEFFKFCLSLKKKNNLLNEIDLVNHSPFLCINNFFNSKNNLLFLIPICINLNNKNEIITWDLRYNPNDFNLFNIEKFIYNKVNNKKYILNNKKNYCPIKIIKLNKLPIITKNIKLLSNSKAEKLNIDLNNIYKNIKKSESFFNKNIFLDFKIKYKNILINEYNKKKHFKIDIDESLYESLIKKEDLLLFEKVKKNNFENLKFKDNRLNVLLFRYKAKFFPKVLSKKDLIKWKKYLYRKLIRNIYKKDIYDLKFIINKIYLLLNINKNNEKKTIILISIVNHIFDVINNIKNK